MMRLLLFSTFVFLLPLVGWAQFEPNYDESKVPEFVLPKPLRTFNGKNIRNAKQWEKLRRPELLHYFADNVYGQVPGTLPISAATVLEESKNALNGNAIRKQVGIEIRKGEHQLNYTVLMYLPKSDAKVPVFLAYNFMGNHSVINDPDIFISTAWVQDNPSLGIVNNQLTEQSRGADAESWPVQKILEAGFGLAVVYYGEIDPDKNDLTDGIQPFFYIDAQEKPADNEWGSIAAWAWGLSRTMDYLETDADVDASKIVVFGHSRLGKTALWAGATDQRFAGVISNNSGCGGAALSKRRYGETIWRINRSFPYWFCGNFKHFNNEEDMMPVDQHELLALIAPRPLYVASALDDQWADPKGEFLSALYATPVYEIYGKVGIQQEEMPPVNHPLINTLSYHIRTGKHGVTDYDWDQYLLWAEKYIK